MDDARGRDASAPSGQRSGDRLRIALVCPFDPHPAAGRPGDPSAAHLGGVERVYAEVSRRLAARGHDVTVVCSTEGPAGQGDAAGVRVVRQRRRMTVLRAPVCDLRGPLGQRGDFDVVQVAATYPFTTPFVLRHAHRHQVPSVLDFHFEPHLDGVVGRVAAAAYRRLDAPSYRLADAVVVRSHAYAQHAPALARVDHARLVAVPNGFDPARFHPEGPAMAGDYLLFVGRLVPYKGLEVLLHALARLRLGTPLCIVGDGPLRGRIEELARRLGVTVRFFGHVPDEQLPAFYRGARLTLLPSVNRQEAFGIALVESMACGTPVVASALPGVADVAQVGGLVAPPGDAGALADAIGRGLAGPLARSLPLAAKVRQLFGWDAVAQRMEHVYLRVARREALQEVSPLAHPGGRPVL